MTRLARRLHITGCVQGVGFRPTVVRLARRMSLAGWVQNTMDGVLIHIEGDDDSVMTFHDHLNEVIRPPARIETFDQITVAPEGHAGFGIRPSSLERGPTPLVEITPDLATCPRCLAEVSDPDNRRYGYALNTCTDCGPRFAIQHEAPFDRDRTSMTEFSLCESCRAEYEDPDDRRFHAQNTACSTCGPQIWIEPVGGVDPLEEAAARLCKGEIVAVMGISGVHLMCDATDPEVVARLRSRKNRPRKPLAVLFETIADAERHAVLDPVDRDVLGGPAAPLILVPRHAHSNLAPNLAPGLNSIGVLRAHAPYQFALLRQVGRPLVATSANASDEPMPIDTASARADLAGMADAFLFHDRTIVRHADDSVVRTIGKRAVTFRVGRGLAPLRLVLPREVPPMLAVGGHLKAAIALARGREMFLSQHVGNLDTLVVRRRYREVIQDLKALLSVDPSKVACDTNPDYETTRVAESLGLPLISVQHHTAHVFACLADHGVSGPALGIAWDGTGLGVDGTIWGGEFLLAQPDGTATRMGSISPFRLVGGDHAAREPRRSAAGVCHAAGQPWGAGISPPERRLMASALESRSASTTTTSVGRLFDAWAFFCGVGDDSAYEGEPAMRLEELADPHESGAFAISITPDALGLPWLDWRPWVAETLAMRARGVAPGVVAARFHNALAQGSLEMVRRLGVETVVLTGGCFQNRRLSESVETLLTADGFRVLAHSRVPPGDGGLAVGQLWAAALRGDAV